MPRQDTVDFLTAFAVGTVLGIGATLLLQPEETRRDKVVKKLKPYRKQMRKSYDKLARGVRSGTDATSDLTSDVIGAGRELLGDFREEVSEILEQARAVASISETEARSFLHRFLFGNDSVFQLGVTLSYGERARLALALLVLRGANVLLLDEPHNHLDLQARKQFEEALATFNGTILMVLHDRYAMARLATRAIEVRDGGVAEINLPAL